MKEADGRMHLKPTMTTEESEAWRPDVKGWAWDLIPMYRMFAEMLADGAKTLELGSWRGRSLLFLATELHRLGKRRCEVWGADTLEWTLDDWPMLISNMNATPDAVLSLIRFLRLDTVKACSLFVPASLDLVMIDAAHDYDSVHADIAAALPLVKPGGWMSGHDYNEPGVKRAVDELVDEVDTHDLCWWAQR